MRTISALLLVAFTALPAYAHFNMLMPQTASAKKGEDVVFTYQWGHPYEHELFDAPAPDSVQVLGPDGKTITDLTKALQKISLPAGEGKKVAAYQFHFTPEQRGDYVFLLRTPPIWMESDGEFLQDNVKVVLHVQAQKGWDDAFRSEFELTPLTRPYGLEPGMVFQAALGAKVPVKPVAGALVEIEHYHAAPPKEIPADEYATRAAKTGPDGVVTATLTDPGWWCLAAAGAGGMKEHNGESYPVKRRSIFWVHVDEKIADK
jgi:cobalt/nickel transport protein